MDQTDKPLPDAGVSSRATVMGSVGSSIDSLCLSDGCLKRSDSLSSEDVLHTDIAKTEYATSEQKALADLCINTIRFLCIDAINNAKSGHPGICMGMAPAVFVLFDNHLRFNPCSPKWLNRDRFVLSAGHGSMLLYALLFVYGYKTTTLADIKAFRKLHSKTPGHPECTETPGVEVCTGPLGQGICNAVGMAISEAHVASVYNRPGCPVVDNYTYCLVGDGCMMEGMSGEACSLAGHLKLGKLIVLYDDNHISIDGFTDLTFTEDVSKRFASYGWQVLHVEHGNTDIVAINEALHEAKRCGDKPTLIKITTTIGYGAPNKKNSASAHGSALGKEETNATRKALGYEYRPFEFPLPALEHFGKKAREGECFEKAWQEMLVDYKKFFPALSQQFDSGVMRSEVSSKVEEQLRKAAVENRSNGLATRKHSNVMLNTIAPILPSFIGGAADTSPSTLTDLKCSKDFTHLNRTGRNIRFGVREHAMAAIANGISLAGYSLRPYCSTFLVFSDYMRAAMRMASLSRTGTIFVLTHDSIGLGEDGPSHQPVEHLASLRAMPNHDVWRPADSVETGAAYSTALNARTRPSTLALSRQTTVALGCSDYDGAKRGGYVLCSGANEGDVDGVIIATGSEVSLAVDAARCLHQEHRLYARVVSLPCWEEFERQQKGYRRSVLCVGRERTVSVEAGSGFGWTRYADYHVCVDEFGKSGSGKDVLAAFGVTADDVVGKFLEMMEQEG